MQWVWENQSVEARCEQVSITPSLNGFDEFPADPDLFTFDPDDRKYVAVALWSQHDPTVMNAVDPDWWEHRSTLVRNGVKIRFLCPQHMQ